MLIEYIKNIFCKQLGYYSKNIRGISLGKSCLPLGLNISELPFEWYDIIIILLLIFTTYQLYKRTGQVVKLVIKDYPHLKDKEKKILLIARIFVSLLVFTIVLFIIEDLFFDVGNFFLVPMKINTEWIKSIKVIKYILVLFLKPLLIYINYRLHGVHSWRFWLTILSALFFVSFLIVFFSNYWNITIFQEVLAFIVTLSLGSISLGGINICNVIRKGSKLSQDITEDLVNSNDIDNKNKRKSIANDSDVENNRPHKRIEIPRNADERWFSEYEEYMEHWSPDALKDVLFEIRHEWDANQLRNRLDTLNKIFDDIKRIESNQRVKYHFYPGSNLPRWVTMEEAKIVYESERKAAVDQLRILEKDQSKENLHMKHRDDKYEIGRNQHLDNVRQTVTSEEEHKKFKIRHQKVVSWNLKRKIGDARGFPGIKRDNQENNDNNDESQ